MPWVASPRLPQLLPTLLPKLLPKLLRISLWGFIAQVVLTAAGGPAAAPGADRAGLVTDLLGCCPLILDPCGLQA